MPVPVETTQGSDGSWLRLGITLLLVLANGFFVAAEFAFVGARRSKLQQQADQGDRRARRAASVLDDLDRTIAGTQLGITLASLALGWIGEPAVASLLDAALRRAGIAAGSGAVHSAAAVVTGFVVITYLHMVLGELIPKSLALRAPEGIARWLAPPVIVFSRLTAPVVWLIGQSSQGILRLFGVRERHAGEHVHSPEELRLLVMQAHAQGTLDESDSQMLAGVFDFHEKKARDVMRPRTAVVGLPLDATEDEAWAVVRQERYSRYPVYRGTLDDVVGVLLAKDLFLRAEGMPWDLEALLREPLLVPDTRPAGRVLDDLRKTRAHLAVVLDEYGGTAGIVTMEDLVEEVVGDIADEDDQATRESIEMDGVLELDASLSLVDARSDHRLPIPEGEWTTLGGYVFSTLGRLPRVGDRVPFPGGEFEVTAMDARRVAAVRVHRARQPGSAA
jgi:CBS domain containing-hemolysin-like protein